MRRRMSNATKEQIFGWNQNTRVADGERLIIIARQFPSRSDADLFRLDGIKIEYTETMTPIELLEWFDEKFPECKWWAKEIRLGLKN